MNHMDVVVWGYVFVIKFDYVIKFNYAKHT